MRIANPFDSDKIYVSIASYRDAELYPTVYDLFQKAKNPKRIYVSIFAQDENPPDLQPIFDEFGITSYKYGIISPLFAKGVGYARSMTQKDLTLDYKYYFQIDSHTRFVKDWDKKLIDDYETISKDYEKLIISSYPPGYEINFDGTVSLLDELDSIKLISDNDLGFEPKRIPHPGIGKYHETGFFAAGQAFGYSELFLETPYDPNIFFNGEEQTMSLRLFENGVRIVCTPRYYIYHDYDGTRRKRLWNDRRASLRTNSASRVKQLVKTGLIDDKYGLRSHLPPIIFAIKFVRD